MLSSVLLGVRKRTALLGGIVAGAAVCLAFLFCARDVGAQTLSGINGTVVDANGGVVPGAKVKVTNVDTNVSSSGVTTSAGTYYITDLIPGTYTVTVEKTGFEVFVVQNVIVVGGTVSTANATLTPGAVQETVTVNAPSVALETEQPQFSTTIPQTLLQDLPQIISGSNRQIDNFIFLAPGVTGDGFSHRIDGGVDQQTEVMFNGVPEVFSEVQGYTFWNQPPYDSIKDVDVLTGTFSAQYGLSQGVEQYNTKSGTNQIHGDAFGFYRDSFFDAAGAYNDIFGNNVGVIGAPNRDHEIDWGFSVGGPVILPKLYNGTDKTFWYFSWDKYRQAFAQAPVTIPTPAMVPTGSGANFSGLVRFNAATDSFVQIPIYVPIAWNTNPSLMPSGCVPGAAPGQQFPGNIIPQSCISKVSQSLLSYVPAPTAPNAPGNNLNYNPAFIPLETQSDWSVAIDQRISPKQSIHGVYWRQYFPTQGGWIQDPLNNATWNQLVGSAVNITYSYTLSPDLVMTLGGLWVGQRNNFYQQNPISSFAGAQPSPSGGVYLPGINFSGGGWEPVSWGTGGWQYSINDKYGVGIENNWLYQHGRHTMNFGIDIRKSYQDDDECQTCAGNLTFGSDLTADPNEINDFPGSSGIGAFTGNGFASFLLGDADTANRSYAAMTRLNNFYIAPYFQDDTQITPRLKINWGLRWDLAFPFTNDNGSNQLVFWNESAPNPGEISTITGQPLQGAMSIMGEGCAGCSGWDHMDMHWNHFSPRLGFTYQLNKKTVLLGGLSWYYLDTGDYEYGVNKVAVNYGNELNGVYNAIQEQIQIPGFGQWDTTPLPSPAKQPFTPTFLNAVGGTVAQMERDVKQAYDEQFVIGFQRELPWSMFLSVSGVHTHDLHLPASLESALNSLNYTTVQSVCPPGESTELDCAMGSAWTCTAQTLNSSGQGVPPCAAPGAQPQAILQSQGFGQAPCTVAGCPASGLAYAPYVNFVNDWGAGAPLYQAEAPYPTYQFVSNDFDTSGADKYNGLLTSIQKRTGNGMTFLVSYTLSRYLTNTDSGFSTFNFRGLNPANPGAEWSVGNNDQTHVLTMAGAYELPFGSGRRFLNRSGRAMNNLVGGWEVSTVNSYESGAPVQLEACGDQPYCDPLIFSTNGFNRPNALNGNFEVNWNNYYKGLPVFNTSSFSYPGAWRLGNGAPLYNALRYPFTSNENLSVAKKFFFTERVSAKVTMQYFNVLNRMIVGNCLSNNVTSSSFGLDGTPGIPCQGNTPRQGQAEFQLFF
jgi:hypothetical protein